MAAGVFGYMGYDMVRLMEELPEPNPDTLGLPDCDADPPHHHGDLRQREGRGDGHLARLCRQRRYGAGRLCARPGAASARSSTRSTGRSTILPCGTTDAPPIGNPRSNTTPDEYKAMVLKAKDYIAAGDIFQVVLSQRFETEFTLPPFALYRSLRRVNPSPFLYYLDFDRFSVIGSSPEILVRVRDGKVSIRPIAGTRRRGATPAEDRALAEELLADPKERAEHLMLLDLGRNDVGRVADIGSIKVTDQFILEYYSQVMHIVSNVEGKLSNKYDAIDALVAGFPAGTVSGAPKVRAMEIIDEFEKNKRGVYAGCVGYFSADGEMDTCIVLRTAIVKDGKMYVQAGAGVVADSVPESRAPGVREQGQGAVPRRRGGRALRRPRREGAMIILIDNYDSFTYNLYHFLGDIGAETVVHRNDKISVGQVISARPEAIVISPGPATPNEAGICLELIEKASETIPVFGVCLGLQSMGQCFGGKVVRAPSPDAWQDQQDPPHRQGRVQGPAAGLHRDALSLADRGARQPAGLLRDHGGSRRPDHGPAAQDAERAWRAVPPRESSPPSMGT